MAEERSLILKKKGDALLDLYTTYQKENTSKSPENPLAHHFVHLDFESKCGSSSNPLFKFNEHTLIRVVAISINIGKKKIYGPYFCGKMKNEREPFVVGNHIHTNGYVKWARELDAYDSWCVNLGLTVLNNGLLASDWNIAWESMNQLRFERIEHRSLNRREFCGQKLPDDILDTVLSKVIKRTNAILNMRLYNGIPDDRQLSFWPKYNYPGHKSEVD